jgi:hypothetical protein
MAALANKETGMPMLPISYRANPEKMSDAPIDEGCRPMTSRSMEVWTELQRAHVQWMHQDRRDPP